MIYFLKVATMSYWVACTDLATENGRKSSQLNPAFPQGANVALLRLKRKFTSLAEWTKFVMVRKNEKYLKRLSGSKTVIRV